MSYSSKTFPGFINQLSEGMSAFSLIAESVSEDSLRVDALLEGLHDANGIRTELFHQAVFLSKSNAMFAL